MARTVVLRSVTINVASVGQSLLVRLSFSLMRSTAAYTTPLSTPASFRTG